jgi:serine/threonine protein kinase
LAGTSAKTIERYTLEALIGRAGMGEVYRAVDRLVRKARAAAPVAHPNTVAIDDLGESGGRFDIVMELVNGMPLLAHVGDDRVPLVRKLRCCADGARAPAVPNLQRGD